MKLNKVLGVTAGHAPAADPFQAEPSTPAPTLTAEDNHFESAPAASADEDDTLSYFAKLAKES
jgi:hypothetical protein